MLSVSTKGDMAKKKHAPKSLDLPTLAKCGQNVAFERQIKAGLFPMEKKKIAVVREP
jgi:hypothetical protein